MDFETITSSPKFTMWLIIYLAIAIGRLVAINIKKSEPYWSGKETEYEKAVPKEKYLSYWAYYEEWVWYWFKTDFIESLFWPVCAIHAIFNHLDESPKEDT